MREYADEYEFDEDQRVILYQAVRSVDLWFLKEISARAEQKAKTDGKNPKRGHGRRIKTVLPLGEGS